jgi:hypothetical protein
MIPAIIDMTADFSGCAEHMEVVPAAGFGTILAD